MTQKRRLLSFNRALLLGMLLGVGTGYWGHPVVTELAQVVSQIVINFLKLLSLPIIFFSIVSTISGMESFHEMRLLGRKVFKYTFSTTLVAAAIALALFMLIDPLSAMPPAFAEDPISHTPGSYLEYLLQIIPGNIVTVFAENNVIGALVLALLLSFAILSLPKEQKEPLQTFFGSFFAAILKVTQMIASLMPFGVWGFVTLFMVEVREKPTDALEPILLYIACVVGANLIQGLVVLPLLLLWKKIPPFPAFKGMMPALIFAFFSKSSGATLPMALKCSQENLKVSKKVSSVSLPLCATINMNGCAAFILTTVLFVSMSHGVNFSLLEMLSWVLIATIAAIGNAGVPMGCYFLSSAFLAAMGVPLHILGIILPVYTIIDMIETSLNVWSDSCVTIIVDRELKPLSVP